MLERDSKVAPTEEIHDQITASWIQRLPKVTTLDEAAALATSALEGGADKAIKDFLRAHRGPSIEHAHRGIDWLLYLQTQAPRKPWSFVTPQAWDNDRQRPVIVDSGTGRDETNRLYGTGFSIEVGNGIQKGWGGRSR
ncbi:hypothetical protein [Brevibacterium sp. FAM 27836]|uniref:hypothetical protein n=1 Tax=Brevibacterium sp. FAM 27836 TaxID=3446693 RepID=UPI003F50F3F5